MKLIKFLMLVFLILSSFNISSTVNAEEISGVLGASYPAKGFYIFSLKKGAVEDEICESKYMIPVDKKNLVDLVKIPDGQSIRVSYTHKKVDGGGTRLYCIVDTITLVS